MAEPVGGPVNHPPHYNQHPYKCKCGESIECIDIIEWLPLNIGTAIKYCWREGLKNDDIEDLKKAVWYLEREIQRRVGRPEKQVSLINHQDSQISERSTS